MAQNSQTEIKLQSKRLLEEIIAKKNAMVAAFVT